MPLLTVHDLSVVFARRGAPLEAVRGVSFALETGEILGLVGESGSGKTVTCRAILKLLPGQRARISGGAVLFEGQDLVPLDEPGMRRVRGAKIAMVFQNPASHLDPVMTIGRQIAEAVVFHERAGTREARTRALELLRQVGIPDAERQLNAYSHQLSGGMRQRAMIAMALSCRPKLLIADEPTTALDVTVQAQILRLLLRLRDETGLAIILITHNLGVVAQTCDRIAVMYAGRIVERGAKQAVLARPLHPYTEGLVRSQPKAMPTGEPLLSIEGQPPTLTALPAGCAFHPRCRHAETACRQGPPPPPEQVADRETACSRWRVMARNRCTPEPTS
ncbi:MAG: ABC transporter ATP-binding protein, partial [Gemmatimonadales bacterium]